MTTENTSPKVKLSNMVSELTSFIETTYENIVTKLFEETDCDINVIGVFVDAEEYNLTIETDEDQFSIRKFENDLRFKQLVEWDQEIIDTFGQCTDFRLIEFYKD